jgi:hypothetical protein
MFLINLKQDVCGFLPLSPVPADFVYSAPAHYTVANQFNIFLLACLIKYAA